MAKKLSQSKSIQKVFSYCIWSNNFAYKNYSMEDMKTLNLTIGSCQKLKSNDFQNIVIEIDKEPFTINQVKLISKPITDKKYYIVAYTWSNQIVPIFTNEVSEILLFINNNLREQIDKFQRVQIVNCKD